MYLDCTLRDGGYYTNWDFDSRLVELYLRAMEKLPIEVLEVGYRSKGDGTYKGEYFHLPNYRLEWIRNLAPSKEIAVMLNEIDASPEDLSYLIDPVKDYIDVVRLAVKPQRFDDAIVLAKAIKERGLKVAFNLMYLSSLIGDEVMSEKIGSLDGIVDYFSLVDSYGGIYPNDLPEYVSGIKSRLSETKLGYHGHNNMELAFANSMISLENGCDIIDGTITGMGRGAGNLKTELWLTWLGSEKGIDVDYNALSTVTSEFEAMQKEYEWGTKLAYMVSGANSLPQKDVMDWVTTRSYSLNSIVTTLNNQKAGREDNKNLPVFEEGSRSAKAIIIGGGPSVKLHKDAIQQLIKNHKSDLSIIYASSTNAIYFQDAGVPHYHCLVGNEGHRLERVYDQFEGFDGKCILPPFPRKMGTYIPEPLKDNVCQLKEVSFTNEYLDSHTALAIQTAINLGVEEVLVVGYDGYKGNMNAKEQELYQENEFLFEKAKDSVSKIVSITPSTYKKLNSESIYGLLLSEE